MSRRRRRLWIAAAVVVFLGISFELARWLSLENVEQSYIVKLLTAEARGERSAMLADLHDCTPVCMADVRFDASHLRRRGAVKILADQSQTAYALSSRSGFTRIAWNTSQAPLPVVQCVVVSRSGNVDVFTRASGQSVRAEINNGWINVSVDLGHLPQARVKGLFGNVNGPMGPDDLVADFRARASTVYHPVGTCRMGPSAADSVVDAGLKVHGIERLRVADASVFPTVTSANTNAPTVMVAQKCADLILKG